MTDVLTVEELMRVIPNRYPILYIDQVSLLEDRKIVARKQVTINEDFFQHQPSEDLANPGTLVLETLAQAGSIMILQSAEFTGRTAYIGGINHGRFLRKVRPGDTLELTFMITKMKGNVGTAEAFATVAGERCTECEFTFIVGEGS